MSMNYTVRVFPLQNPTSKLLAYANIVIEEFMEVKGFKIFQGPKGAFVKAPSKPSKDKNTGETVWWDDVIFHEDTPEGAFMGPRQKEIFEQILVEFNNKNATNTRAQAAQRHAEENTSAGNPEATDENSKMQKRALW